MGARRARRRGRQMALRHGGPPQRRTTFARGPGDDDAWGWRRPWWYRGQGAAAAGFQGRWWRAQAATVAPSRGAAALGQSPNGGTWRSPPAALGARDGSTSRRWQRRSMARQRSTPAAGHQRQTATTGGWRCRAAEWRQLVHADPAALGPDGGGRRATRRRWLRRRCRARMRRRYAWHPEGRQRRLPKGQPPRAGGGACKGRLERLRTLAGASNDFFPRKIYGRFFLLYMVCFKDPKFIHV
ncbi:hypothetical protein PVAP13_3NG079663 [Panicum virgatum]|uniref:Uncharacterized protein n=1 Tax=Panicum virgatum TaxID=38727 RepID=A0A8T0U9N5_PANVG|nr:hypothetical protein PVAP13_3NG079663 [Panicum virgatum]